MSDVSLRSILRQFPAFAHATETQLSPLAQQVVQRPFIAGEVLFLEGDPSAGLWILENGRL